MSYTLVILPSSKTFIPSNAFLFSSQLAYIKQDRSTTQDTQSLVENLSAVLSNATSTPCDSKI